MSPRSRRLVVPLAVGAATLGAAAYVALVDPNEPGHYPLCPTKALTGLDCPFCGGLRATHALLHGDLVGALDHNAFVVVVVLPLAVVAWTAWLVREWRGPATAPAVPEPIGTRYAGASRPGTATGAFDAASAAGAPSPQPAPSPARPSGWADPRLLWALLALAVVFSVVRNLDAVPALAWLGSDAGAG